MNATVLTFNIFQLRFKGSRRRAALALDAISEADPDVIVLNEVFNRPARGLVRRLGSAGYHTTPHVGGFGWGWTGVSGRPRGLRRIFGGGVYVLSRF
ncbi:MAG: endonuclease/exonuclease/phosphatase family protein, partial [Mycobacteriaceae bacterium]